MSEPAIKSSGNVFVDLGYSSDEAAILQMRADLMANLRKFIKAKKLSQTKAAELFGVSQSRVSERPISVHSNSLAQQSEEGGH